MAFRLWQPSQGLWGLGAGRQKRGFSCSACPLSRRYWSPSSRDSLLQWENVTCLIIFYSSTSDICKSQWVSGGFDLLFYSFFLLLELNFYDRHSVEILLAKMGQAEWASLAAPYPMYIVGACYSWPMNPTYRNLLSDPPKMGSVSPERVEGCAEQRKRHQKMAALCWVQFHCAELQTVVGTFTKQVGRFSTSSSVVAF